MAEAACGGFRRGWLAAVLFASLGATAPSSVPSSAPRAIDPAAIARQPNIVDAAQAVPGLLVDLKYASADNFMRRNVYGELRTCYLHRDSAAMLAAAAALLKQGHPELKLLAYDCLRPRRVQRIMWDLVKGTPQQGFVANPETRVASLHNRGCAIDLTLASGDGSPLDMGTPFDSFSREAQPRHEIELLRAGKLTGAQVGNRLLLREVMVRAGFTPVAHEWWHFDCASPREAVRRFPIVE
ncbi:MAG: M15 family metallopeptidase [Deltaproteobacteria bacterium]|nr:M15 family metallopeptidase [Deltaproteobacteria bacterium]